MQVKSLNLGYDADALLRQKKKLGLLVLSIRKWIKTEKLIPNTLTNAQIIPFLYVCDFNESLSRKCIKEYFISRNNAPEIFSQRNLFDNDVQRQLQITEFGISPISTDEGFSVLFSRPLVKSSSLYNMEIQLKLSMMQLDAIVYQKLQKGVIVVFDMNKCITLGHITKMCLGSLAKICNYLNNGLPLRIVAIHVINATWFFDKIINILTKFIPQESMKLIHIHSPQMDMDMFFEKYIPRKCLPSDYGGDLPSFAELHKDFCHTLEILQPYFDAEQRQREHTTVMK